MKLSEALRIGIQLRPECHVERFAHVEGRGLCSDVWGAICEAVQPAVAKFNWNRNDPVKLQRATDALNAVQLHYFFDYFNPEKFPAACPGAKQSIVMARGRLTDRRGTLKTEDDYARVKQIGGITNECALVDSLAGAVDHMFYKHGWSREQCLEAVEAYENQHDTAALFHSFEHFSSHADKHVRTLVKSVA